jgi:hypothetical protein
VINLWANSNNWYQSEVEDLKLRLPRGGDPTSASGRATIGRWSDRVETVNMPSSARRRTIAVWRSNTGGRQGVVVVKVVDEDDR